MDNQEKFWTAIRVLKSDVKCTINGDIETEEATRNDFGSTAYFHLDSPNTTSATTYVTSFANYVSGTGAARVNNSSGDRSSMILMEIAG